MLRIGCDVTPEVVCYNNGRLQTAGLLFVTCIPIGPSFQPTIQRTNHGEGQNTIISGFPRSHLKRSESR